MYENSPADDRRRNEQWALSVVLLAITCFLVFHVAWARRQGGMIELQRLPKREFDFKIELNNATVVELMQLPGVGKTLAARIVEHREQNGCFRSADDLLRVKGIGPKLSERIKPYITVTLPPDCDP